MFPHKDSGSKAGTLKKVIYRLNAIRQRWFLFSWSQTCLPNKQKPWSIATCNLQALLTKCLHDYCQCLWQYMCHHFTIVCFVSGIWWTLHPAPLHRPLGELLPSGLQLDVTVRASIFTLIQMVEMVGWDYRIWISLQRVRYLGRFQETHFDLPTEDYWLLILESKWPPLVPRDAKGPHNEAEVTPRPKTTIKWCKI